MLVIFEHTGQRRYAVRVKRAKQLDPVMDLVMDPAPGYDPAMPHDLLHLVVEAQLGLTGGIFGQLAAGGTAGTFRPIGDGSVSEKTVTRLRNRMDRRGKRLLRENKDDGGLSERATYICWHQWLARSASADRRKTAQAMTEMAGHVRSTAPSKDIRALNEKKIEQICAVMDELSAYWSRLAVGESMTVRWPDLAVSINKANSAA